MPDAAPFSTARIDDLERIPLEYGSWRPVRRPLGVTGFAVNAYSADAAVEHLRRAFAADPRAREWAEDDADLDTLRGRPDFPV